MDLGNIGKYSKGMISDVPCDTNSLEFHRYKLSIPSFAEEAIYIYSFKENRMIYAHNWDDTLGYKDEEVNMLLLVSITVPEFAIFSNEMNDKALKFIMNKKENLKKYSFSIELKKFHKNGEPIPLIARVGVFEEENGHVISIIGRYQINRNLRMGKVMRYSAFGPDKNDFEEELNQMIFSQYAISDKELKVLELFANGLSFKEVADKLHVSISAIEKRILPLYKRFDVKNLTHLIHFAHENGLLH
jgi:DNA-binding CsgD family transcriptional regulator